jgi:helicase
MIKKFDFNTKLPEDDNLIYTDNYKYIKYPFEKFNKVQSVIVKNIYYEKNYNIVLATNTSTGKTICAELLIGQTLYKQNKKVIYVSPLKSLTQEKYDDWKIKFKDKSICILTSDFSNDKNVLTKLKNSDIICMTSEMLDSKTRSIDNLLKWCKDIALIIIDEFHILDMESRGHAVEAGLMRFCQYHSNVKIMCLSATVPNTSDFSKWLTNLNNKTTLVLKSDWRPIILDFHYEELKYSSSQDYIQSINEKLSKAYCLIMQKQDEKFLCFVHDKNTGRKLKEFLVKKKISCEFHNADLDFKKRCEIEKDFSDKKNGNRVLISTSTLAWGRSLPARNVIIVGSTRGLQMVDEFDILQMAGRSGRLGIDDKGDCYFLTNSIDVWKALLKNLKEVNSTLIEKDYLEFQILAEIAIGSIFDIHSLESWYKKSLAYVQNKGDSALFKECLFNLEKYGMISLNGNNIEIKQLGKVSAHLYFLPKDILSFKIKLKEIKSYNDYTIAYLLGYRMSYSLPYVPKELVENNKIFAYKFKSNTGIGIKPCNTTYNLHKYFSNKEKNIFNNQIIKDVNRIDQALNWVASIHNFHYETIKGSS